MCLLPVVLLALMGSSHSASPPSRLDRYLPPYFQRLRHLEVVECLASILSGEQMGPGTGWFHPGRCRYDWKWLATRYDANHDGAITRAEFKGPAELFARLDRDGNGAIAPADFDWSDDALYVRQLQLARQILRRADQNGDGQLSRSEWEALFRRAARGKDTVSPEDLRALLFPARPWRRTAGRPPDAPTPAILLKGLISGEIGSPSEGPKLGAHAPDFTLPTVDRKNRVTLSKIRRRKPVVLIFGSFT